MDTTKKLKTGAAYYGNRMLSHAMADMKDMAKSNMDIVIHPNLKPLRLGRSEDVLHNREAALDIVVC